MVVPGSRADDGSPEHPERRFLPERTGGYVYLAVLAVCTFGIVVTVGGDWRAGMRWFALGLVGGGTARAILPAGDAGMLGVRNRYLDSAILIAVGAVLLVLAGDIPDQPGA